MSLGEIDSQSFIQIDVTMPDTDTVHLPSRRYDKGERRFKHVGSDPFPVIELDEYDPKVWVGKCPSTISEADRLRLLNGAIPSPGEDDEKRTRQRLYTVHKGAIYEAQTSDGGLTFHGYPYRGKLPSSLQQSLQAIAVDEGYLNEFLKWCKEHIVLHGKRR